MKIYLKENFIIKALEDYGFKLIENEKKKVYQAYGLEIDLKSKEVKSTSKTDLTIIIKMYNDNILEIK